MKRRFPFQIPFIPFVPLLCIFVDINLIIRLPGTTWIRVGIWLLLGLFVYFGYGMRKSKLVPLASLKGQYLDLSQASSSSSEETAGKKIMTSSSSSERSISRGQQSKEDEKEPILQRPKISG